MQSPPNNKGSSPEPLDLAKDRQLAAVRLFAGLDRGRKGYIDDTEIGLLAAVCLCGGKEWDSKVLTLIMPCFDAGDMCRWL